MKCIPTGEKKKVHMGTMQAKLQRLAKLAKVGFFYNFVELNHGTYSSPPSPPQKKQI
jgi:hypothetical protein